MKKNNYNKLLDLPKNVHVLICEKGYGKTYYENLIKEKEENKKPKILNRKVVRKYV